MSDFCVFCQIVRGESPATVVTRTGDCTLIEPLNPVTPGHVLVIPNRHVVDALEDPALTGKVMEVAAHFAKHPEYHARPNEAVNLITSVGAAATQSVWHLHVHVIPRRPDDGLALPWTGQGQRQIGWADKEGRWIGPMDSRYGVSYEDRPVFVGQYERSRR